MVNALQSAEDVKDLDIKRKTTELGLRVHVLTPCTYAMRTEEPQQNPNVVKGMFLLIYYYTSILIDSGAEKSFVSSAFTPFIDIAPPDLDTSYDVELAVENLLAPTPFDVIVGMDWLSNHRAVIVCFEKIVRIPLSNGEILEVQGERSENDHKFLSCMMSDEKKLEDIPIVRDFPDVFPDDLLGLPPIREIEFRIDLIPRALLVVRLPYLLAPFEMLKLSNRLKELQDKGLFDLFIHHGEHQCYLSRRRMVH
ncbi:putative reverse transcriptase domain-containing protein [Tanacetum coccineum]